MFPMILPADEGRAIAVAVFWYGKITRYFCVLKLTTVMVRGVIS